MSKTFDNISEASATNSLFLFAQRMLALRNESPTPPPLNALGLPCKAMRLLWNWLTAAAEEKQERFVAKAHEKKSIKAMLMPYGSAAKEKADAENPSPVPATLASERGISVRGLSAASRLSSAIESRASRFLHSTVNGGRLLLYREETAFCTDHCTDRVYQCDHHRESR